MEEPEARSEGHEHVFAHVEKVDTPKPLIFQLELLREVGFDHVDVLHKQRVLRGFRGRQEVTGSYDPRTAMLAASPT
jgi:hypothetical protein